MLNLFENTQSSAIGGCDPGLKMKKLITVLESPRYSRVPLIVSTHITRLTQNEII